jgi:anti-sigma factor RsiW
MRLCEDVVPLLGPLLDGALAEDDREWVEDHIRCCGKCLDRKALLAAQAAALREALEARAARADFSGVADRVMARLEREPPAPLPELVRVWTSETWGAHRGLFAAAGGLAAAAGLAMAVFFSPPRAPAAADETLLADAKNQPQFEVVDFGSHDGAMLQLSDRTPVIWLSEDRP